MEEYTKDEAEAFIDAMRMTVEGKPGFRWMVARLSGLSGYLRATAEENALLNAYVDQTGGREAYEAWAAERKGDQN